MAQRQSLRRRLLLPTVALLFFLLLISPSSAHNVSCTVDSSQFPSLVQQTVGHDHGYSVSTVVKKIEEATTVLSSLVADIVKLNKSTNHLRIEPLRLAFYYNHDDIKTKCEDAGANGFITGPGPAVCDFITAQASLKGIPEYMASVTRMASLEDWKNASHQVINFGPSTSKSFLDSLHGGVVMPANTAGITSVPSIKALKDLGKHGFYGSSGGGGGGFGWEIMCVGNDDEEVSSSTLISGGGGGGGGFTSPEGNHTTRAFGGGGGGAQSFATMVGAGSNSHSVQTNPKADPKAFPGALAQFRQSLIECASSKDHRVEIRGGGGGGGGFELFAPWDVTNSSAEPEEVVPHALGFGFGFQFVTTVSRSKPQSTFNRLVLTKSDNGLTVASCPGITDESTDDDDSAPCGSCFEPPIVTPEQPEGMHTAFGCAPQLAQSICKRATAPGGQLYGKFANYLVCNQVLVQQYLKAYLPPSLRMAWAELAGYYQHMPGLLPLINNTRIKAHKKEWCLPPPPGCAKYPAC